MLVSTTCRGCCSWWGAALSCKHLLLTGAGLLLSGTEDGLLCARTCNEWHFSNRLEPLGSVERCSMGSMQG
jgi:hypothetical protein